MNPNTLPKWDQIDYLNRRAELEAEASDLEAKLKASGRNVPARPTIQPDDLIQEVEALEAHVPKCRVLLRLAIPTAGATASHTAKAADAAKPQATASQGGDQGNQGEAIPLAEWQAMTLTARAQALKAGRKAPAMPTPNDYTQKCLAARKAAN